MSLDRDWTIVVFCVKNIRPFDLVSFSQKPNEEPKTFRKF